MIYTTANKQKKSKLSTNIHCTSRRKKNEIKIFEEQISTMLKTSF